MDVYTRAFPFFPFFPFLSSLSKSLATLSAFPPFSVQVIPPYFYQRLPQVERLQTS